VTRAVHRDPVHPTPGRRGHPAVHRLGRWQLRQRPGRGGLVNGLYKAELIGPGGPWRTAEQVELATLAWVQWWNQRRLHGALDHIPPAEHEARYYRQLEQSKEVV